MVLLLVRGQCSEPGFLWPLIGLSTGSLQLPKITTLAKCLFSHG